MTPGARLAAAGEILSEIIVRKAAADRTISAWGKAHRFAGSKDRAAIGERVFAVLRRYNECAFAMGSDAPRALVLGSLKILDGLDAERIDALCTDGSHALGGLSASEREYMNSAPVPDQSWITLNYPEWLHEALVSAFGDGLSREMGALCQRAPLDLRVNTLKAQREDVVSELQALGLHPALCKQAAAGIRLSAGSDVKVTQLPCYLEGRVDVQDESSQIAVHLAAAREGDVVVDLAAGGGGKALALAAAMQNKGQIIACDVSHERLQRMMPRIERAGATIIDIAGDPYSDSVKLRVGSGADLVFIDAPCSGSGTWRRNPESKWTLDAERLGAYRAAQAQLLERAAALTGPRGRIVYAVCSVLPAEGPVQVESFCSRFASWSAGMALTLTPARSDTDGFFVAELKQGEA